MSTDLPSGWIKWHRCYRNCAALGHGNEWMLVGAWAAIVEKAQRVPTTFAGQAIGRGEFGFTYRLLEDQWGKSHHTLKPIFDHFSRHGMIEIRKQGSCSILKVVNYEAYQGGAQSVEAASTLGGPQRGSGFNGSVEAASTLASTGIRKKRKKNKNLRGAGGATCAEKPPAEKPPTEKPPAKNGGDFERFWTLYPARDGRKREKEKARKEWRKLSPADRQRALEAVRAYAAEERYVKDAFRWLRDRNFDEWSETCTSCDPTYRPLEPPKEKTRVRR